VRRRALVLIALAACRFHAPGDSIDAAGDDDAPGGGDAAIDAPPDAPRELVLREGASSDVAAGHAVFCHGAQLERDNAWLRAFRPADFGATGTYRAAEVRFGAEQSRGAVVTATLYAYDGATGGSQLDLARLTPLATNLATIPDSDNPRAGLSIAVAASIAATDVVVAEIAATDAQNAQMIPITYFHLGANIAGQTAPSYYRSSACGIATPSAQGGADFVIEIGGTY